MNSVSLSGNLTEDPKLIHRSDRPVCEMRLAVDNGRHPTTYIDVRAFDEQAYVCAEYLVKGQRIGVDGKLVYDEWRADDGTKRSRYSVIGRVEFLDRPSAGQPVDEETGGPNGHEPLDAKRELVAA
jgi:single-strand DNA-binding protein